VQAAEEWQEVSSPTDECTWAELYITNHHNGKILDWKGWQHRGQYEDEHGNSFRPINLTGWSWLPHGGNTKVKNGDFGKRIAPGETYENNLYIEKLPKTSHELIMRFPCNDMTIEFKSKL
jgi:hypothetical protein